MSLARALALVVVTFPTIVVLTILLRSVPLMAGDRALRERESDFDLITFPLGLVTSSVLAAFVAHVARERLRGGSATLAGALAAGSRRAAAILATALAQLVVTVAIVAVVPLVGAAIALCGDHWTGFTSFGVIGWRLAAIPVLAWCWARCLLAPAVVMSEDCSGFAAVRRSFVLTRGLAWPLLALCLVAGSAELLTSWGMQQLAGRDSPATLAITSALDLIVGCGASALAAVLYLDLPGACEGLRPEPIVR
jgi:hypothetical protein